MFERYTERARRVLFFARYEASELGNLSIETEHLLLGLIREGKGLTNTIFARANVSLPELRQEIVERTRFQEKVASSVEIPFSEETKRVLRHTADEANRLHHDYIGTEHLLLGLLHEERSVAGSVLIATGLRLDAVRETLVEILKQNQAFAGSAPDDHFSPAMYVLTAPQGPGPSLRGPVDFVGERTIRWRVARNGSITHISATGCTIGMLCQLLEETLGSPFADSTNLSGRYDFEVHSQGIDSADFLQALRAQLGLVATIRPQGTSG
jgi:Clp amino terminal domain, pathogenicity island component/Protein of unknown function (DUF3738)